MAGTIVVDRLESDASYASKINVASPLVIANTISIGSNLAINSSGINAASLGYGTLPSGRLPTIPTSNMPTGSVVQVVRGEYTTTTSTTNTSNWSNIGSATITPSSASNKILVTATYHVSGIGAMRLLRNSTSLGTPTGNYMTYANYPSNNQGGWNSNSDRHIVSMQYYDSPATTSSTTYNVEMIAYSIVGTTGFGVNEIHGGVTFSGITLMEIVA